MKPNYLPLPTDDPESDNAAGAGCMARLVRLASFLRSAPGPVDVDVWTARQWADDVEYAIKELHADWYSRYAETDRAVMVIQTMIDHAFNADDDVPGDHVVERLYNLIAAIHPEGALPNPLSEYMEIAESHSKTNV